MRVDVNGIGPFDAAAVEYLRTTRIEGAAFGNCRESRHRSGDMREAITGAFE